MPLPRIRRDGRNLTNLRDGVDRIEVGRRSGDKGRVSGGSRHAQDGYLLEKWVLDFGGIGDLEKGLSLYPKSVRLEVGCSIKEVNGGSSGEDNVDGGGEGMIMQDPRDTVSE